MSLSVCGWLCSSLPLTEKVVFKTMFQRGNRVQVPRRVRWQFKMDSEQVLKVTVFTSDFFHLGRRAFMRRWARMGALRFRRFNGHC